MDNILRPRFFSVQPFWDSWHMGTFLPLCLIDFCSFTHSVVCDFHSSKLQNKDPGLQIEYFHITPSSQTVPDTDSTLLAKVIPWYFSECKDQKLPFYLNLKQPRFQLSLWVLIWNELNLLKGASSSNWNSYSGFHVIWQTPTAILNLCHHKHCPHWHLGIALWFPLFELCNIRHVPLDGHLTFPWKNRG
jgi:hypothetical protein